jgi:SAM-dependent methyltransferase
MSNNENYLEINRASWNNKTKYHYESDFYDVAGFLKGASSLNPIELELLGNIQGKTILHLQCHFGQDSISLARMGADVTGVDLSDVAIQKAKELNQLAGSNCEFICCNIYDLPNFLNKKFDIVFTSYGTIGWLPDMNKWAKIISLFLKPGGEFVFAEFHPAVWMFDDEFEKISYNYFNDGAIYETSEGSYADRSAPIEQEYVMWNHSLSEVINALMDNGLNLSRFNEYDYSPYNCFKHTVEIEPKKFRIKHLLNKIPMVFALKAKKPI